MKQILPALFLFFFVLLFPKNVSAVTISLSNSPSSVDTNQEFTIDVDLVCTGCGVSYLRGVFFYPQTSTTYSGYTLNNTGDWINLSSSPSSYFKVDSGHWSGQMQFKFDTDKPTGDYYFKVGRYTANGTSFSQSSEDPKHITVTSSSSTPIPTASPTETPTPTPTPSKSTYTINKSKDETGQELSSVEIYIDSIYTHHLDNEILEFCNGCFCDSDKAISCGYGQHTIKLTKSGYSDWSEIRNFTQGTNYEITPILTKFSTPTPTKTPTPTQVKTPTPTLKSSPTPQLTSDIRDLSSSPSSILGTSTSSAVIANLVPELKQSPPATSPSDILDLSSNTTVFKYTFVFGAILTAISGGWLYFRHHSD